MPTSESSSIFTPPAYCAYSSGPCDQDMTDIPRREAFFAYPSSPAHLSSTVSEAVKLLRSEHGHENWLSWEDLATGGQVVFCAICKAMRGCRSVVANVTSLNFNVLFELGFAIGLRKPLLPTRDALTQHSCHQGQSRHLRGLCLCQLSARRRSRSASARPCRG